MIAIVDTAAPADASLVARALAADHLPREVLDAGRDHLAERIAEELDGGDLLPLDAIEDALTAHRRIHQAARWLARHGQLADARELAAAVGLA